MSHQKLYSLPDDPVKEPTPPTHSTRAVHSPSPPGLTTTPEPPCPALSRSLKQAGDRGRPRSREGSGPAGSHLGRCDGAWICRDALSASSHPSCVQSQAGPGQWRETGAGNRDPRGQVSPRPARDAAAGRLTRMLRWSVGGSGSWFSWKTDAQCGLEPGQGHLPLISGGRGLSRAAVMVAATRPGSPAELSRLCLSRPATLR